MIRIDIDKRYTVLRHHAMATEWTFWVADQDARYAAQAVQEAFRMVDGIEIKLSLYQESSDVSRINRAAVGEELRVSEECIACLTLAFEASRLTGQRYHAFLGAEACRAKGALPAFLTEASRAASDAMEGPTIALDGKSRRVSKLAAGALLDLGGIGKGFALSRAALLLEEWGIETALLSAGGSSFLGMAAEGERPWQAGLEAIRLPPFGREALSSSGLGFQENHIIDPATRQSASRWSRSYVYASDAGMADALSTAALLMPAEDLVALAGSLVDLSVAVEDADGRRWPFGRFFAALKE